jgi:hypothetical protein
MPSNTVQLEQLLLYAYKAILACEVVVDAKNIKAKKELERIAIKILDFKKVNCK